MHRSCSGSQGHVMGPCTCGMFHSQTNSFSMLFSMPNHKPYDESEMYSFTPSSSSVDCTLSLGTPSTRYTEDEEKRTRHERRSVSNFCWDLLQPKHNPQPQTKTNRGSNNSNSTNDPLLARRCANCDTTSTPLWRNGPRGPKSLCNACGIRFKKEERRASAAAAATPAAVSGGVMESAQMYSHHNNSWYAHQQSQKMQCLSPAMSNEFRFVDDGDQDSDNGIPFLSWRLNVTDRTSLIHDFTR
ncbi:GATA transcription factor 18 [Gastrolobium bilobum]|uniref:GATA transcription factor 18 n=1 Tax=Gastrolobium bilobum TaxID=150636 RepID=UPI002AB06965|nr:GATA transcription factor 18 [Gastrolobium bilobum]